MKTTALLLALVTAFAYSCKKENNPSANNLEVKDTVTTIINNLKFKLCPTANDELIFSVPSGTEKTYRLLLMKDNKVLLDNLLISNNTDPSTTLKYNFAGDTYKLSVRSTRETQDTVFQEEFDINNYIHTYHNRFTYEKLATINQHVDVDISPSHNTIFYVDMVDTNFVLKRLSIPDKKLDVLDGHFFSTFVRAKSDNQLIVYNKSFNGRYLKDDSCALLNYDVNTHATSFIDWGYFENDYYSRIVNNSMLISTPLNNSVALIDLTNNTKKTFPGDGRYISETNFTQICWNGKVLDFSTSTFVTNLPFLDSNTSSLLYYDKNSDYYITEEYSRESASVVYTKMIIYKNNQVVYKSSFEKNRSFNFPSEINLTDNKLIFKQNYEYDTSLRYDGYYLLNIATKEITLLQNDGNHYYNYEFFTPDKSSFISIRPFEIYKLTMK